ncbi:MAG: hypothetical protein KatS3mg073_0407 [Meiothermus sp.]|nr:MAG: hypothetical protein KatS3mg073_0407 [Meiothermus sp.]
MTTGNFYGETATGIHRAVDLWNHNHPGQPLPRALYRALIRHGKPKAPPGVGGLERLRQIHSWYDQALTQSWHLGGGEGLSNGAYRAGHVQDGILPVDNKNITNAQAHISGLKAYLEATPGTVKMRIRGQVTPRPVNPDARRGQIEKLTRQALSRLTARTRELEARGFKPDYLLTLTYPGDWRGALMSSEAEPKIVRFRECWERLEDLRSKIKRAREAMRYNPDGDWVLRYLLEEFAATKSDARKILGELRTLGPDGRKVKEHKNSFLKRFERKFGAQHLSSHCCYAQALKAAQEAEESGLYVSVKVRISDREGPWKWEVVGILYRVFWWLEFQKRGAPHLHMIFFDVREGLDWDAVQDWVGHAWGAVVAGRRSAKDHSISHNPKLARLLEGYDTQRELWGKKMADLWLQQGVEALGLNWGLFQHVRAGTRLEAMRKAHWGYVSKEAAKYASKKYQSKVPQNYRKVGRWWGHRHIKRTPPYWVNLPIESIEQTIIKPIQAATSTLPPGCFRFRQKLERFFEAARNGEPYGYITVWGQAAVDAALEALDGV